MTAMDRRNAALAMVGGGASTGDLVASLADIEETVVGGLSLPPDQLATIAACGQHEDSGVRLAWARVLLQRGWRGKAVAPLLDRLWAWSEDAPEGARERRRDAWVALARALPASRLQTPLMNALLKAWRRAPGEEAGGPLLELIEGLASVAALPDEAVEPLTRAVDCQASAAYRRRCLMLWWRLALGGPDTDPVAAAQATSWLESGQVTAALSRQRMQQVIARKGNRDDIEALLAPGDFDTDEHVASCLAPRLADATTPAWLPGLLAAICERHRGGGPAYEAMVALRRGTMAGVDLSEALPILHRCWRELSYDRGPWDQTMDNDLRSDLALRSARRDALWLAAAGAEQQGHNLDGLAPEVTRTFASPALQDLSSELSSLDRCLGAGAADRARKKLGIA